MCSCQVALTQALFGAPAQRGNAVAREAEDRRHLGVARPLDLRMPQHRAPALGQRQECSRHQRPVQAGRGGVEERLIRIVRQLLVYRELPAVTLKPVVAHPPHGHQQIRPERVCWPAAVQRDTQHLGEGLADDVVDLGWRYDQIAGQPPSSLLVPLAQYRERGRIPSAHEIQ